MKKEESRQKAISKNMKSQVSTETMFVIGVILIVFLFASLFTFSKRSEIRQTESFIALRNECNKIANSINYLAVNGIGSKARLSTKYFVITKQNKILIKPIKNETNKKNKIAAMITTHESVGNPSENQALYDNMKTRLNPDWYSNCDTDNDIRPLSGKCVKTVSNYPFNLVNWHQVNLSLNITRYNTIFMDDIHIKDSEYDPSLYPGSWILDKQEEFVRNGGVLMWSEHHIDAGSGNFFGIIYNKGAGSGQVTVQVDDPFFPNLTTGDTITFAQVNKIVDDPANNDAQNMVVVAKNPSTNDIGIAYWDYGLGKVFFLEDFALNAFNGETDDIIATNLFDNMMTFTIKTAFLKLISLGDGEAVCNIELKVNQDYQVTGQLEIENVNHTIIIKNYE